MRFAPACLLAVLALGCKSTTKPADPWVGVWQLVSVDGKTLPADTTINGFPSRVVSRSLDVRSSGKGLWTDSTLSTSTCSLNSTGLCNASGQTGFTWTTVGDTLHFLRVFGTTIGTVVGAKTFVKQLDGTLLKTDDGQTEVYHR